MNREILFRGKDRFSGEWRFGDFMHGNERKTLRDSIWEYQPDTQNYLDYQIDPATVGQYTGLTDKNGVKIFEGDIVHIHDTRLQCCEPYHEFDGHVDFADGSFRIVSDTVTHYRWIDYEVEVTGNIHDNPELLQEAAL